MEELEYRTEKRICRENPLNEKSEQCVKFAPSFENKQSESTGENGREKRVLGCVD
jgi:hypothetical protein